MTESNTDAAPAQRPEEARLEHERQRHRLASLVRTRAGVSRGAAQRLVEAMTAAEREQLAEINPSSLPDRQRQRVKAVLHAASDRQRREHQAAAAQPADQ